MDLLLSLWLYCVSVIDLEAPPNAEVLWYQDAHVVP